MTGHDRIVGEVVFILNTEAGKFVNLGFPKMYEVVYVPKILKWFVDLV